MQVEVLIDRKAGDLSITTADDTDGHEVESTLSVEEAWKLVTELNYAIQSLTNPLPPKVVHHRYLPRTQKVQKSPVNAEHLR